MTALPDVPRYAVRKDALIREAQEFPPAFPHGYLEFVVLQADHLTAMQAAQTISSKVIADFQRQAREAALREALAAVEALYGGWADWPISLTDFGAAISAIQRLIDGGDAHD